MRLLFHIGAPKTGTTSIQEALFDSQQSLLESGFYVMFSSAPNADAALHRTEELVNHSGLPTAERQWRLDEELATAHRHHCHTIIVSCEPAFGNNWAENLLDLVPDGVDVHVLAYLRPQEEWILRIIVQDLQTVRNEGQSLESALDRMMNERKGDFSARISALAQHPRSGTLHLYRLGEADGDVVAHFAGCAERISGTAIALPARRSNPSPGAANLGLLSLLDRPRDTAGDLLLEYSPRVVIAQSLAQHPLGPPLKHLPDTVVSSVRNAFRESNQLLLERFGVDLEADLPELATSTSPATGTGPLNPDDVSLDGMVLLLHALLRTAFEIWNTPERAWTPLDDECDHELVHEGRTLANLLSAPDHAELAAVHQMLLAVDADSAAVGHRGLTLSRRLMAILHDWHGELDPTEANSNDASLPTPQLFGRSVLRILLGAGIHLQHELMSPEGTSWEYLPHDPELEFVRSPWVIHARTIRTMHLRPRYEMHRVSGFLEYVVEGTQPTDNPLRVTLTARGPGGREQRFSLDPLPEQRGNREPTLVLNTHVLSDGPFRITVDVTSPSSSVVLEHDLEVVNGNGSSARYLKGRLSSLPAPFFAGPVSSGYFRSLTAADSEPDFVANPHGVEPPGPLTGEQIDDFQRDGFVAVRGLVPEQLCADASDYLREVDETGTHGFQRGSSQRLEHLHQMNESLGRIFGLASIRSAVRQLLGDEVAPAQSLTFIYGSTQSMHQDTIHLSNFPASQMCGVWIALEDVRPEAGELRYLPGSHRWPRVFLADLGIDPVDPSAPKWEQFGAHYKPTMHRLQSEHDAPEAVPFLAQRGDIGIWHENLMHAGSPRSDPTLSRHSMVIHYFTHGCLAWYDSSGVAALKHLP